LISARGGRGNTTAFPYGSVSFLIIGKPMDIAAFRKFIRDIDEITIPVGFSI
jgi:hypothetical protein